MAKKTRAPATRKSPMLEDKRVPATTGQLNYIDLSPESKWSSDEDTHTLVIKLPYFKVEDMNVSLDTGSNTLSIKCERPVIPRDMWMRFAGDFPVPEKCDVNEMKANYENGLLSVIFQKTIMNGDEEDEEGEEDETMKKMSKHGVGGHELQMILTGITLLIVLVLLWMISF